MDDQNSSAFGQRQRIIAQPQEELIGNRREPMIAQPQEESVNRRQGVVAITQEPIDPLVGRRQGVIAVAQESTDPLTCRRQEIPAMAQTVLAPDNTFPVQDVVSIGCQDYNDCQPFTTDPFGLSMSGIAVDPITVNDPTKGSFSYF